MYNDRCIANHRSTVHQVRKSEIYPDQSAYLTIEWSMSNTAGRKWGMRYILIYSTNSIPRTMETERKYGTRELEPKIDHKISRTKGPKERCSKNNNPPKK